VRHQDEAAIGPPGDLGHHVAGGDLPMGGAALDLQAEREGNGPEALLHRGRIELVEIDPGVREQLAERRLPDTAAEGEVVLEARGQVELLAATRVLDHMPAVAGARVGMDDEDRPGALALGLFDLVPPAPEVGHHPALEQAGVDAARVVDPHDDDLVPEIGPLEVVPLPEVGVDAEADEDGVPFEAELLGRTDGVADHVLEVAQGPAAAGDRQFPGGEGLHHERLEVVAPPARHEVHPLEHAAAVELGEVAPAGAGSTPLEEVVTEQLEDALHLGAGQLLRPVSHLARGERSGQRAGEEDDADPLHDTLTSRAGPVRRC